MKMKLNLYNKKGETGIKNELKKTISDLWRRNQKRNLEDYYKTPSNIT